MNNHVHLLIKKNKEAVSVFMKKINVSYVHWFNKKYDRIGHLFQDRYKSEPVENDSYLLTVVRYIHQNPVKIGLPIENWTSYSDYLKNKGLVNVGFILECFSGNRKDAVNKFIHFMNEKSSDVCIDSFDSNKLSDKDAEKIISEISMVTFNRDLQRIKKDERNIILSKIKKEGIPVRQIARITGINRSIVIKA